MMTPSRTLLGRFLMDEDVPCPDCGYNLRGGESAACPECGCEIALTIGTSSSPRGMRMAVLVMLAWLFVLGGVELASSGFASYEAYHAPGTQRAFVISTNVNTSFNVAPNAQPRRFAALDLPPGVIGSVNVQGGTITVAPGTGGGGAPAPGTQPQVFTVTPPSPWSRISGWQWAGMSIGLVTTIGAMSGLLLLFLRRRAPMTTAAQRRLAVLACIIFAAYAGLMISRSAAVILG